MSDIPAVEHIVQAPGWLARARMILAVALVWAVLHYVVQPVMAPRGFERPAVLVSSYGSALLAPIFVLLMGAASYVAILVGGTKDGINALVYFGLALAIWCAPGGTMDDWLRFHNESVSHSARGAYLILLADYLVLLAALVAVCIGGSLAAGAGGAGGPLARALRSTFALDAPRSEWSSGIATVLMTSVVASAALLLLTGPRVAWTRRGQVFFAVAFAFMLGALAAQRFIGLQRPLWYGLAPALVGVVGLLVAAIIPTLPHGYDHLNIVPASALVRPLPIEMIGIGVVAVIWTLQGAQHRIGDNA